MTTQPKDFGQKSKKSPLNVRKRLEVSFQKISSSKRSYGQVKCCFDNPNYFFWQKADYLSQNVRKWWVFFHKIAFLHNFRIHCENSVLTAAPKKLSTQSNNFFVECRKCLYFVYSNLFIKMFRWTRKILFWHPRQIFSGKRRIFYAQCPERIENSIHLEKFTSWKNSYVHAGCSFDVPTEIFSTKGPKIFNYCPKKMEKNKKFKNKLLPIKMSFGRLGLSFDNPNYFFSTEGRWLVAKCPKVLNFFSKCWISSKFS